MTLCNEATIGAVSTGDSTEIALLELAKEHGVEQAGLLRAAPRIGEVPFDSARKMMSTVHEREGDRFIMTRAPSTGCWGNALTIIGTAGNCPSMMMPAHSFSHLPMPWPHRPCACWERPGARFRTEKKCWASRRKTT